MELTLQDETRKILSIFLLILLPLLLILIGAAMGFMSVLYYTLTIFWFGIGLIFFEAIQ
ncbi:MAG: hypothetical protein QCH96_01170 [Candidatus Thermoplasmatota archaeon]|nr:hypothetical protein [Candidatus Thermoplasmatota archaeon]